MLHSLHCLQRVLENPPPTSISTISSTNSIIVSLQHHRGTIVSLSSSIFVSVYAPPDHRRADDSGKSKCKISRVLAKSPSFSIFYVRVLHMHTFGVPYSPFVVSLLPPLFLFRFWFTDTHTSIHHSLSILEMSCFVSYWCSVADLQLLGHWARVAVGEEIPETNSHPP
ncbi:hypothetical protein L2E82_26307 [Cichorium intybus]|uniref:Uncharacterized protein n=1 Tax=Cichorium intybus TaxID=13427 RepID=A0ACB9CQJ6_CICIN|nr:hypothetical protein L2E82_26307 [Cichorium intybus]